MLKIKLFGTGQAQYLDHPIVGFSKQQPCVLLCYLLLNKDCLHRREHLASNFWGQYTTSAALKRLRNAIWLLRKKFQSVEASFDEYFQITADTISFIESSNYWLDVDIFENTVKLYQNIPGRALSSEQVEKLEIAVDLYEGDLLENIYDDWVVYERELFCIQYLNALGKLMMYHGLNGNYKRGLEYGECILTRDCTREKIHRRMMWLHSVGGDRSAAIAQYKRCRQTLQEELGIKPMYETQKFFYQLKNDQFNPETWIEQQGSIISKNTTSDSANMSLGESALRKLYYIQDIIDETSVELRLIENLISKVLGKSDNTNPYQ